MVKKLLIIFISLFCLFFLFGIFIPSPVMSNSLDSPSCTPIPKGLVYWLRAENNTNDFTTLHNGILYGNTAYVPGKVGVAFTFDGNEDNVVIPSSPSLPVGSEPRTLEMWIYTVTDSWINDYRPAFFSGIDGTRRAFGVDFDTYPVIQFLTWGDDFNVTTSLPVEGWFHIAFVYDGNLNITAYVNGLFANASVLGGVLETYSSDHFIGSGIESHGYPRYFLGKLDEISFYDRALSSSEILNIYQAGSAGKCTYYSNYLPFVKN